MHPPADLLHAALAASRPVAVPLALIGGVVAGLNPCCVGLYPTAAAACCPAEAEGAHVTLWRGASFAVGAALATSVLGIVAALTGRALIGLGGWVGVAIACVPIVMGLQLLGWIRLPLAFSQRAGVVLGGSAGRAFVAGMLVSFIIAPCGTPVLAAVLAYAATSGQPLFGGSLLFAYGLGAALPVVLVGTTAGTLARRLAGSRQAWVERCTGAVLVLLGFYLLWAV